MRCAPSAYDRRDPTTALSGWLAGSITRVGAAQKAQLAKLGLRVVDASRKRRGIINHDLFLSNGHIRQVIRRAIDGRPGTGGVESGRSGPLLRWLDAVGHRELTRNS